MNSENSKTSKLHVLILKLTDKLDLRRDEILVFTIHGNTYNNTSITQQYNNTLLQAHTTIINLKYKLQHEMMNFNY